MKKKYHHLCIFKIIELLGALLIFFVYFGEHKEVLCLISNSVEGPSLEVKLSPSYYFFI